MLFRYGIEDVCYGPSSLNSSEGGDSGKECGNKKVITESNEHDDVIGISETEYVSDISIQNLINDAIQFVELHPDLTRESDYCCQCFIYSSSFVEI